MKKFLLFVGGFITGIIATVIVAYFISSANYYKSRRLKCI